MALRSEYNKGIIALILLAFFSVVIGVIVRELNPYFSEMQQIYIRLGIASFLGFFLFRKKLTFFKIKSISVRDWFLILSRAVAGFLIASPLWVAGFNNAKLPNAVLIDSIPMSSVLGFVILREHVSFTKIILLALSFSGALIVSIKDFSGLGGIGKGELLIFLSGIFFAFRNISRKWHSKTLDDATMSELLLIAGFILLMTLSLVTERTNPFININFYQGLLLIAGGIINIFLVFLTNYGFSRVDAVNGGNITLTGIVFGVIFGLIFYREVPSIKEAIGGTMIIVSVVLLNSLINSKSKNKSPVLPGRIAQG